MAGKRKLKYRIYDPNPAETTAEYIVQVLVEVNRRKIESQLREAIMYNKLRKFENAKKKT